MRKKKVAANIKNIKRCVELFIMLHHHNAGKYNEHAENIVPGKRFVENQDCPHLRPDQIDTPVCIGSGERKFFDDLLPCQCINTHSLPASGRQTDKGAVACRPFLLYWIEASWRKFPSVRRAGYSDEAGYNFLAVP